MNVAQLIDTEKANMMTKKTKKTDLPDAPVEVVKTVEQLIADYEVLRAKVNKAQEIHWMVNEVYGHDSDIKKQAWKAYQNLQDELHMLSVKIEENSKP